MQVEATVTVRDDVDDERARLAAEFALERQAPPGYAVDWHRVTLAASEPLPDGRLRVTWRGVAVPLAVTRSDAPVSDLPAERRDVNRARQAVHPLVEHRPLHC